MWIEIGKVELNCQITKSRPARALWIEIMRLWDSAIKRSNVEAREGLVD